MNTPDVGGQSRWAAVRERLRKAEHPVFDRLAQHYDLEFYEFAADVRPTTFARLTGRSAAAGVRTDLAAALGALAGTAADRPSAGVLLVSDGRDNGDGPIDLAATTLKSRQIPVWTTAVGTAAETRDLCVSARLSQNFLFARQPASVSADLLQSGYANWYAEVTLWRV